MSDASKARTRRKIARAKQRYAEDSEFREKVKTESRVYRITNAEAVNLRARVRKYGLSVPQFTAMVAQQNGICAVCLKVPEKGGRMGLCIDHDHGRRKLRSLLCGRCNLGLGNFKDDSAALRRAADYVDYWQWRHADPRNTGPPILPAGVRYRFSAADPRTIQTQATKGDVMTPTDEPSEESKASRIMRRAILHELLRPFDPDPPPPVDMLQAVSRAVIVKASQGDITAAKEVFDRIGGRTPTAAAPAPAEIPNEVFFTWQRP
jgi:hypothetical protein